MQERRHTETWLPSNWHRFWAYHENPRSIQDKHCQTIIPAWTNFTVDTMHSDKRRFPGRRQTQTLVSERQTVNLDLSIQRIHLHWCAVHWRHAFYQVNRSALLDVVIKGSTSMKSKRMNFLIGWYSSHQLSWLLADSPGVQYPSASVSCLLSIRGTFQQSLSKFYFKFT